MPRTHGYALIGQRCWRARGRTNVIGELLASTRLTVTLFTDTINADVFFAWLWQDLLPKLPPNSDIVMDNAAFRKRADSQQLIEQAGASSQFSASLIT
jgi:DDE superfamily endonuclease